MKRPENHEILEIKHTVDKVKISSEGLNNRLGMTEDSILENRRNLLTLKRKGQKQKTMKENIM